jgi:large subunit ribosomal protein L10
MAMSRAKKEQELKEYKARFEENETVVVTHYSGLSVKEVTDLRARLRAEGGSFKVMKNTLARIAMKDTQFEGLDSYFKGPVGVAASQDPVAAAKAVYEFSKENDKLVIIGGGMGATVLDQAGVEALAKMPSLDELRGKLVGLLVAPAQRIATILQVPASNVVGVLQAKSEKGE